MVAFTQSLAFPGSVHVFIALGSGIISHTSLFGGLSHFMGYEPVVLGKGASTLALHAARLVALL